MADNLIERQRTRLQRRKISAAIKLDKLQRSDDGSVKQEVIHELEHEYTISSKQLNELEARIEARNRREIRTLQRLGVTDSVAFGVRYSLPDIEIHHGPSTLHLIPSSESPESENDAEDEDDALRKKHLWKKPLGWLTGSPLFRPRTGSGSVNRKYRAMSADVVASRPPTTVTHLRSLYTGRSEFYDIEDEEPVLHQNKEALVSDMGSTKSPVRQLNIPVDAKTLEEINQFEQLIVDFFRNQHTKRH